MIFLPVEKILRNHQAPLKCRATGHLAISEVKASFDWKGWVVKPPSTPVLLARPCVMAAYAAELEEHAEEEEEEDDPEARALAQTEFPNLNRPPICNMSYFDTC